MKIKDGYLLKEVGGNFVVVPVGNVSFNGMLSLNETAVLIWKKLEEGCTEADLLSAFLEEYDVTEDRAKKDISLFVEKLKKAGILDESQ
ncbi:MAG: PqqD family protein [Ruminococcaceae bacterium]|nr:PqqD family protein [Oscillospiraceae bacterium]